MPADLRTCNIPKRVGADRFSPDVDLLRTAALVQHSNIEDDMDVC